MLERHHSMMRRFICLRQFPGIQIFSCAISEDFLDRMGIEPITSGYDIRLYMKIAD